MGQIETKQDSRLGRLKSNHFNNYIKCKWIQHTNKNARTVRLDFKMNQLRETFKMAEE